jgi:hypothetical protein
MASEKDQEEWNDATNTSSSADYSMQTWGDEKQPSHLEELMDEEGLKRLEHADSYLEEVQRRQRVEEQQSSQGPFDYTPWIAAQPMPLVKEIEQGLRVNGLKLRKQIQADL